MQTIINKFRRSTNSTQFIAEIDGLRFYAIFTVLIFHFNTAFSRQIGLDDLGLSLLGGKNNIGSPAWWLVRLDLGVKVFFAISGMVLALPYLRNNLFSTPKIKLNDYFYRRLTRLEPPFIVSLLIFLCVHVLLLNQPLLSMFKNLGAGLLYSHVFIFGYPNPINPITWSLETEAQFYILVPLFFYILFLYRSPIWCATIFLVSFSLSMLLKKYFITQEIYTFSSSILAYFSNFGAGIIVALIYLKYTPFFLHKSTTWDFLGILAIIGQFYFYKPQHLYLNNILFNLSIMLMIIATFKGIFLNWFFTRPIIYIIGGMCYSIYLLHYAFFHLIVKFTAHILIGASYGLDLLLQLAIVIPITLIVSGLFYLMVEKPCMDKYWPQRLTLWIKNRLQKVQ